MNYYRKNPLVSICIPTYNGSKFLSEALASIEDQIYRNIEVVLSDDNSWDDTLEIIENFKKRVDFSVHIHHHQSSSIGANWNNCIKKANGTLIKFLFQDDLLLPEAVKEMVDALYRWPKASMISCKRFILAEEPGRESEEWRSTYGDLQKSLRSGQNGTYILNKSSLRQLDFMVEPVNVIGEPTCTLIKKSVFQEVGFFDEELEQILDFEFYCRLLKNHTIVILDKPLVSFRLHKNQTTQRNKGKELIDSKKFSRILFNDFFWALNWKEKKRLLILYCATYRKSERLRKAVLRRFRKF